MCVCVCKVLYDFYVFSPFLSVSFDPIYGSSLLTTAHNNEIRVYHSHSWEQPAMLMKHPHRHFQHLTNIRASWHPFYEDLCLIGRYPDSGDADQTRCVDVVDTRKGEVVGKLYDPVAHQITTVRMISSCIGVGAGRSN